jgi:aldehyde dehydrogenase (NAD+)
VNIVTGARDELAKTLAQHDDVAAMWYFGTAEGSAMIERESAGNLKATWVNHGRRRDWAGAEGQGRTFLEAASQLKTIWAPYGA